MTSFHFAIIKLIRYSRLFEMDSTISDIIEKQAQTKTVYEVKQIERMFDLFKFALTTSVNLHIMSCTQILLCKSRGDYENSWMG